MLEKAYAYRRDFEAARDFEMDDDELFCPFNLMTEDDVSRDVQCSAALPAALDLNPSELTESRPATIHALRL